MDKQITTIQKCILCRNDVEIWIDSEKADKIRKTLMAGYQGRFIEVEDRIINVADISGIFSAQDLEDVKRRKIGQWKCNFGSWHGKGEACLCVEHERQKAEAEIQRKKEEESEITPEQAQKNREAIEEIKQNLKNKLIL